MMIRFCTWWNLSHQVTVLGYWRHCHPNTCECWKESQTFRKDSQPGWGFTCWVRSYVASYQCRKIRTLTNPQPVPKSQNRICCACPFQFEHSHLDSRDTSLPLIFASPSHPMERGRTSDSQFVPPSSPRPHAYSNNYEHMSRQSFFQSALQFLLILAFLLEKTHLPFNPFNYLGLDGITPTRCPH